jgi:hypothetical protein
MRILRPKPVVETKPVKKAPKLKIVPTKKNK